MLKIIDLFKNSLRVKITAWAFVPAVIIQLAVALVVFLDVSQNYRGFLILLLILGSVIPSLFVAFGVRRITRPIEELIDAANEVAGGNFNQQIEIATGDEIAELGRQFNHMAAQLHTSYAEMEQKVQERTKELAILNTIAQATSQSLDLDTTLATAMEKVLEVLDFDLGVIYLIDAQSNELRPVYELGFPQSLRNAATRGTLSFRAAETGRPVILDDLASDPDAPELLVAEGFKSSASIPLFTKCRPVASEDWVSSGRAPGGSQHQVQGVLSAASRRAHTFRLQDVDLLTSIGHQIGVAIENARLYETEQKRAEQFRLINEVGHSMTSILVADDLLKKMTHLIQATFDYYHVGIGLLEDGHVVYKAGAGLLWRDPEFTYVPSRLGVSRNGSGLSGYVAATGEALMVPDVSADPRYVPMAGSQTRSELVLPIKAKGEVIGVLDVQKDLTNAFDEIEITVLQSLANQAGVVLENARLYEQAQQLGVLEERQRLARDLHDSVTQSVFGVTLYAEAAARLLEANQPDVAATHLRHVRDTAREALAEMRLLIYELRPSILEEEGLIAALQARLESVEGRAGLQTSLNVEDVDQLPPDIEEGLYWISQELLNNVLKHARARQISVSLCRNVEQGRVQLTVSDDGVGFDSESVRRNGGLGLKGVTERINLLHGDFEVQSEPDAGTMVVVNIRLP